MGMLAMGVVATESMRPSSSACTGASWTLRVREPWPMMGGREERWVLDGELTSMAWDGVCGGDGCRSRWSSSSGWRGEREEWEPMSGSSKGGGSSGASSYWKEGEVEDMGAEMEDGRGGGGGV